ncbi:hypothetical protein KFE25_005052 [Diacronema lutheri]|uniref:Fibronectin type-III domain-containing protein n=1 Tax=Diacronema lutheri TaxID=2081491 RepID=A0A8J6C3F9_DIALT|nr:hypothetical protein KFE25_005052 [Diacronema lutheri]
MVRRPGRRRGSIEGATPSPQRALVTHDRQLAVCRGLAFIRDLGSSLLANPIVRSRHGSDLLVPFFVSPRARPGAPPAERMAIDVARQLALAWRAGALPARLPTRGADGRRCSEAGLGAGTGAGGRDGAAGAGDAGLAPVVGATSAAVSPRALRDMAQGIYALHLLGIGEPLLLARLRECVASVDVRALFHFDPSRERAPHLTTFANCACGGDSDPASRRCSACLRPLTPRARLDVLLDALVYAFHFERLTLPAPGCFFDVLRQLCNEYALATATPPPARDVLDADAASDASTGLGVADASTGLGVADASTGLGVADASTGLGVADASTGLGVAARACASAGARAAGAACAVRGGDGAARRARLSRPTVAAALPPAPRTAPVERGARGARAATGSRAGAATRPASRARTECGEAASRARDAHYLFYAMTHLVYTLNGFDQTRLGPHLLPRGVSAFLRTELSAAIVARDPDKAAEAATALRALLPARPRAPRPAAAAYGGGANAAPARLSGARADGGGKDGGGKDGGGKDGGGKDGGGTDGGGKDGGGTDGGGKDGGGVDDDTQSEALLAAATAFLLRTQSPTDGGWQCAADSPLDVFARYHATLVGVCALRRAHYEDREVEASERAEGRCERAQCGTGASGADGAASAAPGRRADADARADAATAAADGACGRVHEAVTAVTAWSGPDPALWDGPADTLLHGGERAGGWDGWEGVVFAGMRRAEGGGAIALRAWLAPRAPPTGADGGDGDGMADGGDGMADGGDGMADGGDGMADGGDGMADGGGGMADGGDGMADGGDGMADGGGGMADGVPVYCAMSSGAPRCACADARARACWSGDGARAASADAAGRGDAARAAECAPCSTQLALHRAWLESLGSAAAPLCGLQHGARFFAHRRRLADGAAAALSAPRASPLSEEKRRSLVRLLPVMRRLPIRAHALEQSRERRATELDAERRNRLERTLSVAPGATAAATDAPAARVDAASALAGGGTDARLGALARFPARSSGALALALARSRSLSTLLPPSPAITASSARSDVACAHRLERARAELAQPAAAGARARHSGARRERAERLSGARSAAELLSPGPAFGGILWAYSNTIGTIELSWDAAVGGDGEITYALFAEEGNVNFARKGLVEPPQATFNSTTFRAVLTNLTAGANYSLLVVAVDEEGDRSGNREPARVTVADVDPMLWPNNTLVKFSDATTLRSDSEEQVTLTTRELPLPDEFKVDAYFLAPLVDGDVSYVQILSINVTSEEPLFVAVLAVWQEYSFDTALDAAMFLEEGADGGPNASVALMGGEPLLNRRRLATISRTFSRTASNTFGPVVIEQTFSTSVMVTASFRIGLNRVCRRICLFLCRRGRRSPRTFCFPNPLDPFVRASASAELGASYSFNALGSVSASTAANSNIELFRGPKIRVQAGPIPIVLEPSIDLFIELSATATGEINLFTEASASIRTAVSFDTGRLTRVPPQPQFNFDSGFDLSIGGELTARIGLTFSLDVKVFDAVGLAVGVSPALVATAAGSAILDGGLFLVEQGACPTPFSIDTFEIAFQIAIPVSFVLDLPGRRGDREFPLGNLFERTFPPFFALVPPTIVPPQSFACVDTIPQLDVVASGTLQGPQTWLVDSSPPSGVTVVPGTQTGANAALSVDPLLFSSSAAPPTGSLFFVVQPLLPLPVCFVAQISLDDLLLGAGVLDADACCLGPRDCTGTGSQLCPEQELTPLVDLAS